MNTHQTTQEHDKHSVNRWKMFRAGLLAAGICSAANGAWAATSLLDWQFNEGKGNTTDAASKLVGVLGNPASPVLVASDSPSGAANDKSVSLNIGSESGQGLLVVDDSNGPILNLGSQAFTMETWIKLDPNDARQYEGIAAYGSSFKFGMDNKQLEFTLFGIVDITSGLFVPQDGAWHHVAAVWEPGVGVTIYLDDQSASMPETRLPRDIANNLLTLGAESTGGNAIVGFLDRFRMHKGALTADQLDNVANSPKAASANTLVAYGFNETGAPFASAGATARPAAGNSAPVYVSDTPSGKSDDYAIRFQSGQVIVADDASTKLALDSNDPSFTLQAWVKFAGKPSSRMVFFFSRGAGGALSFSVNIDRTVFVTTLGVADVNSKAAIPDDGNWHHIAVVHENGKELRFYVDGSLGDTVAYTGGVTLGQTETNIYLGAEPGGTLPFTGSVDRLKVSAGALAVDQLDAWPVPGVKPEAPSLTIQNVVQVSWPTSPAGYTLQSSTDLDDTKNWATVTNTPAVGGQGYYLLFPTASQKVFYRLYKP